MRISRELLRGGYGNGRGRGGGVRETFGSHGEVCGGPRSPKVAVWGNRDTVTLQTITVHLFFLITLEGGGGRGQ